MGKSCDRPIIVVGMGRSGSSIFHRIFSHHTSLAWLSSLLDRYPERARYNRWLMHLIDQPVIGQRLRNWFEPEECYGFWEHYCKGFRTPCRDLRRDDLSKKARNGIEKALVDTITPVRNRLLIKITGWPRVDYIKGIFDDAIFVYVRRQPHSVANSLLNVDWWWGWRGPQNWRAGELSPEYNDLWNQHNRSFVALAGIECLIYRDAMDAAKNTLCGKDFIEVEYEDLCDRPVDIYKSVVRGCGLDWTDRFESVVSSTKFVNSNYKWREELSSEQQRTLEQVLSYRP